MDIFTTENLNKMVENLDRPASFLLDTFFSTIQTETSGKIYSGIHYDVDLSKVRLLPFVSPLVVGQVVDKGYVTEIFCPAYVKDMRWFDKSKPLKRSIGEKIGGELSEQERLESALNQALREQLANLTRPEEVMASEALRLGKVTVSGEGYSKQVEDFGRDSALTVALAGRNKWSAATSTPLDNLESWSGLILEKSGGSARTVVMDPKAWSLFRKHKDVQNKFSSLNADPLARGQGSEKTRYVGSIGGFDIYVYQDIYVDESDNSIKLLPDHTVILAGREHLEGVRCYGMIIQEIRDEKSGFKGQYFVKSWRSDDPSGRLLLMQSAPLVVPYRPNASLCATIS